MNSCAHNQEYPSSDVWENSGAIFPSKYLPDKQAFIKLCVQMDLSCGLRSLSSRIKGSPSPCKVV